MNEPTARQEIFHLKGGSGRIEVRNFPGANALFVDGKPIALDWADCQGSIGHHVYNAASMTPSENSNDLRETVGDVRNIIKSLSNTFLPLLKQFPSGEYELTLDSLDSEWNLSGWGDDFPWGNILWYYPYPYNLPIIIPAQSIESLNEAKVLDFMYRIEKGERPFLITAAGDCNHASIEFVMDGHHKLLAYCEMRVTPWRLRIAARKYPLLSYNDWPHKTEMPMSWNLQFGRNKKGEVVKP